VTEIVILKALAIVEALLVPAVALYVRAVTARMTVETTERRLMADYMREEHREGERFLAQTVVAKLDEIGRQTAAMDGRVEKASALTEAAGRDAAQTAVRIEAAVAKNLETCSAIQREVQVRVDRIVESQVLINESVAKIKDAVFNLALLTQENLYEPRTRKIASGAGARRGRAETPHARDEDKPDGEEADAL
jgi:hypothetical protein